jgi:hypothetical protein
MTKVVWSAATVIALFVGLLAGLNIGYERSPSRGSMDLRRFRGTKDGPLETGRTTDPTGRFDAVLLAESYGGAAGGGVNWYVSILQKESARRLSDGSCVLGHIGPPGGAFLAPSSLARNPLSESSDSRIHKPLEHGTYSN